MAMKETKIPNAPFHIVRFDLCPSDVGRYFDCEQSWQRKVRRHSAVIPGIQKTLRDTGILRNPVHVYCNTTTGMYVVIDGKHRLAALGDLDHSKRCTIFAVVHHIRTVREAEDLFIQFNLGQPPTLGHFIGIREADGDRAIARLRAQLPFSMKVANTRGRTPGAVNINRILRVLTMTFGDLPKLNRHNMDDILAAITGDHVDLIARFARIFEQATGEPIAQTNIRFRDGWFDVGFRVFIQNQDLRFNDDSWADRFKCTFGDADVSAVLFKPRYGMTRTAYCNFILRALSKRRSPKVQYDTRLRPTIEDLRRHDAVGGQAKQAG